MWEKLKSIIKDDTVFIAALIFLVGVGSFGLGRLSVDENALVSKNVVNPKLNNLDITPEKTKNTNIQPAVALLGSLPETTAVPATVNESGFVASKSGTKYHRLDCPGAKQIKESNKIFFKSASEAEASGYTKAANCPDR